MANAVGVLLFRQHFIFIPTFIVDAARINGAPLRFLIPMPLNVVGSMIVIQLICLWNEYLWSSCHPQPTREVMQVGLEILRAKALRE